MVFKSDEGYVGRRMLVISKVSWEWKEVDDSVRMKKRRRENTLLSL